MKKAQKDSLGERMKLYESLSPAGGIFMPHLPIVCRVDGRAFSRWTRGLRRPFDPRLVRVMVETMKVLVGVTGARVGHTQSDEISLVLAAEDVDQQLSYGSRVGKILSHLGGLAGVAFNRILPDLIPEKVAPLEPHRDPCPYVAPVPEGCPPCSCGAFRKRGDVSGLATFDARAFNVPNLDEAANALLWRELDATRNSIHMAARHFYSAQALHGKGRADQMDMLMAKGVNWNDYPAAFKRGVYARKRLEEGETRVRVWELDLEPLRGYDHAKRVELLFGRPALQAAP